MRENEEVQKIIMLTIIMIIRLADNPKSVSWNSSNGSNVRNMMTMTTLQDGIMQTVYYWHHYNSTSFPTMTKLIKPLTTTKSHKNALSHYVSEDG